MKKYLFILGIFIISVSCTKTKTGNFNLQVKVTGLKKGTVYLEQIEIDSTKILDSIYIDDGNETFKFIENIKEPGLFSISLDNSLTKKLIFFGEPGNMNIETELNKFIANAKISGSEQQDILQKHDDYVQEIKFKNLDIIKERFDAQRNNELEKADELSAKYNRNIRRIYLFSTNYAINNGNHIIGAYIGLTRIDKANVNLKQKVYDGLSDDVKESKYGMLLAIELNSIL